MAFLQEEALTTLATAGSVHLEELSSGRYRLEVVDDEFLVVDTWNGEERRSVKTLSGGESFLASLASRPRRSASRSRRWRPAPGRG